MPDEVVFISESVTEGHPDKLCDQISDACIDEFLRRDPQSRVRVESAASSAIVFIGAHYMSASSVDCARVARRVIARVGYDTPAFNARTCSVLYVPREIPVDDAKLFDEDLLEEDQVDDVLVETQVTVFGYACDYTPSFMPPPIWLARKLTQTLDRARHEGELPYLSPDGRAQVAVSFVDREPRRVHSVIVEAVENEGAGVDLATLRRDIEERVIQPAFAGEPIGLDGDTRVFVNPDGPVVGGGPTHHSGLTGRKNGVDTYGEYARLSGSALSGKDPRRVDRGGTYAARHAAKNLVAAGLARECEVMVSYSIGQARPVSVRVYAFGTGTASDTELSRLVADRFDFRPAAILRRFGLRRLPALNAGGFYQRLAAHGHVGRTDMDLPWERTDRVADLADSA